MATSLSVLLAVLSVAGCVKGYDYEATGLQTGVTVIRFIFALIYIVLLVAGFIALAFARGHRLAYVPLLFAMVFSFIITIVGIASDFIAADGDPNDDFAVNSYIALSGIGVFFSTWTIAFLFLTFAMLIKGRANKLIQSPEKRTSRLSPAWDAAYLVEFVLIIVFGITSTALYIKYLRGVYLDEDLTKGDILDRYNKYLDLSYVFSAIWYISAFVIGAIGAVGLQAVRKAGIDDKVIKTLLFIALPLHVLHIIEDIIFVILFSPSGLKVTFNNLNALDAASLSSVLLSNFFHSATAAVIIFVGIRRSNWTKAAGLYPGQNPTYPAQFVYPQQATYPQQAPYPQQATYPQQTTPPVQETNAQPAPGSPKGQ